MSDLFLPCPCGASIPVTPGQAGTEVSCRCGKIVPVPRLAQLRLMAGKDPYATNPVDRIDNMQRAGQLKLTERCAGCLKRTDGVMRLEVCCERTYAEETTGSSGDLSWLMIFGIFKLSRLLADAISPGSHPRVEESKVLGREMVARIQLRVCASCQDDHAQSMSRETLVAWLRTVPIYAELLDMYPEAEIIPLKRKASE